MFGRFKFVPVMLAGNLIEGFLERVRGFFPDQGQRSPVKDYLDGGLIEDQ